MGCRLNQCESEALAEAFSKAGFEVSSSAEGCALCLVNTCAVTGKAEQKARRMIRLWAGDPGTEAVVATGCYAQLNKEDLEALSPKVVVVGGFNKSRLLELPKVLASGAGEGMLERCRAWAGALGVFGSVQDPFSLNTSRFSFHSRAYLKVQDGCDNRCGYCRVRIARGPAASLPREAAARHAVALEEAGYKEIVLTGVNLTMYDRAGDGIGGLLEALLGALGDGIRLRFSSLEPDGIDPRFLDLIQDPRVQPHFHIPIQSASDKVLARVGRKYTRADLEKVVRRLLDSRPEAFLSCDVITGLPGEGEAQFDETLSFFRTWPFAKLHVFPYSPRPGTPLFGARDRAPESVRDERAARLRALSGRLNRAYLLSQAGRRAEALLERREGGVWLGLTGNYVRVAVPCAEGLRRGDLVAGSFPGTMEGTEPALFILRS